MEVKQITAITPEELVNHHHVHLATSHIENESNREAYAPAWSLGFEFVMSWILQAGATFPDILEAFRNECGYPTKKDKEMLHIILLVRFIDMLGDMINKCAKHETELCCPVCLMEDYCCQKIPRTVAASPSFVWTGHTFFDKAAQ